MSPRLTRRDMLALLACGAGGTALAQLCGNSARAAEAAGSRPNIVIILADDLGWGDLSCYGATKIDTPHCDRLAKEGRRFTDAHAPAAICSPTRYGLLTGRCCWRTNLKEGVLKAEAPLHIELGRLTLPRLLKQQGYATAAVGKWHLGFGTEQADYNGELKPGPLEVGFDYYFGVPSNHGFDVHAYVENHEVVGKKPGEKITRLPGGEVTGVAERRVEDQEDRVMVDKALAWLEKNKDKPFFLYLAPIAVHQPITPDPELRGKSRCGLYGDFVMEADWCVGQVLEALDRLKLAENTLVIFTSDNGAVPNVGETGAFSLKLTPDPKNTVASGYRMAMADAHKAGHLPNGPWRGGKWSIFEGGTREPFIARWPGKIPAGTTCDEIICLTDMLATMAAVCGQALPAGAGEDSYNVLPAVLGEKLEKPIHEALVTHSATGVFAIRQGAWKYIEGVPARPEAAKKKDAVENRPQLYNLEKDPKETDNVLEKQPEIVARLRGLLEKYRKEGRSRPA